MLPLWGGLIYIWRDDLTEGFCVTALGWGGAYTCRVLFSEFYGRLFKTKYKKENNTLFFGGGPSYLVYECKRGWR